MIRTLLAVVTAAVLAVPVIADDEKTLQRPKTGRPGELTEAEEDKLDLIINRFILYDTGQLGGLEARKALADFNKLGPEAIPALIRGLNYAATLSHSCPVGVIGKKLRYLLSASDDEMVLDFARENIGAGVKNTPYLGLLKDLKLLTITRKRVLADKALNPKPVRPTTPTKSPGENPATKPPAEKPPK